MNEERFSQPTGIDPSSNLGARLRALRQARGLSQRDLAERTGFSKSQLSGFEAGRQPALASLHKLAEALGASMSEIFPTGWDVEVRQRFDRLQALPEGRRSAVLAEIDRLLAEA
jgi:transcriptional regulator with XRE-family HTH domain